MAHACPGQLGDAYVDAHSSWHTQCLHFVVGGRMSEISLAVWYSYHSNKYFHARARLVHTACFSAKGLLLPGTPESGVMFLSQLAPQYLTNIKRVYKCCRIKCATFERAEFINGAIAISVPKPTPPRGMKLAVGKLRVHAVFILLSFSSFMYDLLFL